METQELFNEMMENAIIYLQNKGYINIPSANEKPEPDYKAMAKELRQQGKI